MKINNKDLKKLYRAHIMESIPIYRKNCPPSNKIIDLFRSKLSEKQKSKIIDHISCCCFCSKEFEFILETLRARNKFTNQIGELLLSKKEKLVLKEKSKKINDQPRSGQISIFTKISWKYAPLFAVMILVISAFFAYLFFHKNQKKEYRGESITAIQLIEPRKGKNQKPSLEFRWKEIQGADYYILELFDETLFPIWKSKKITDNHTLLPKKIIDNLAPGKLYFWMLTVYYPDGNKIESRIESFVLRK
ncbi:MAG: hypothetical protein ACOC5T_07030 [Elusimicrobiota bacterium]